MSPWSTASAETSARWSVVATARPAADELPAFEQVSGPPLELEAQPLVAELEAFEAELSAIVDGFARGSLETYREQTRAYLAELRQHFLRHHRRLEVRSRSETGPQLAHAASMEAAELARRFRDAVLARASRLRHEPWPFGDAAPEGARVLDALPVRVEVPLESGTYHRQPGDGPIRWLQRSWIRARRRLRRWVGAGEPTRVVPLQQLGRHHLGGRWTSDLEAMLTVLVQGELSLNHRTLSLFEGIEAAFHRVPEIVETKEDPKGLLLQLRKEVEEEFRLAEQEQQRHAVDGLRRFQSALGDAVAGLKLDLPVAGTFELPRRKRPPSRPSRSVDALVHHLGRVQESLAASYNLTGLRLELFSYRASADEALDSVLAELEADVRGRSFTQVERVEHALEELLAVLEGPTPPNGSDKLREVLEPVERVVQEAVRAERQLEEQLKSEQSTAPLVDALSRSALELTERYRVPQANLPRSEWKLPSAPANIEIPFASVVQAFVQTEVAPQLGERTRHAAVALGPLASALSDLERMVQYHPDEPGGEWEVDDKAQDGPDSLRQALRAAARTHREALRELAARSESWARDLGADLRQKVQSQLEQLEARFSPEAVARVRAPRQSPESARGWKRDVRSFRDRLERGFDSTWEWCVQALRPDREGEVAKKDLRPPRAVQVPTFYRRLFGPGAHWAGDVVPASPAAVERARQLLTAPSGLRTVAVVGIDTAGRGAAVSAILQGAAFSSVRRVNLIRPTSAAEIKATLQEFGRGNLVILSGIGYLLSAEPGGFRAFRALSRLVLEDDGRNGWIFEADELTWRWASQIASLADGIMEQVEVRRLDRNELARVIFARHHFSGRRVRFLEGDRREEVSSDGLEESRRNSLRDRYFQRLHRSSEGLLHVALGQWLGSIEKFGVEVVDVRCRVPSPREGLRQLSFDALDVVYLVLRQGWMSATTLAFLLRTPVPDAEARLRRLGHAGLLERSSEGFYTVRGHLRGLLHRTLREGGFL
ncbi:MAG TPA: hypothetical protein RMG48_05920 [Myxococcales bacterium LLY-WYZ-16_1]|jgi:hypothetical protein|nr:hypothetical protein [Myxococcales bacterium LLY-WYZ-16_1]